MRVNKERCVTRKNSNFLLRKTAINLTVSQAFHRHPLTATDTEMDGNRQFQAKTPKNKNRHISKAINRIKTKFEDQETITRREWSNMSNKIKSSITAGRHLEKWL